jgi:3-oxoacyl-[acyl-carrier-protein] synthase II
MKIFIRSASCISPQNTFGTADFLTNIVEETGIRLKAIEPDYREFMDPKLTRRMSRVIKMGVSAAKECLYKAGVEMPGAIITGTAFGCMEDTVTFLTRIVEQNEEMLPPTAFIQSTHNTVAAQIALALQCHNYNGTFVHQGISFESALLDATMLLMENEADNVLVGASDEMVDAGFKVFTRLGLYRRQPVSNLHLFDDTNAKGSISGEGVAFFLLSPQASADNLAELTAHKTFYKPKDLADIEKNITAFLQAQDLTISDIDLVITGRNGDIYNDKTYKQLGESLFKNSTIGNYKHLSGEYSVSSSFALWMIANMVKTGTVPQVVLEDKSKNPSPKRVLYYNHYLNKYHSMMLVSAV